MKNYSKIFLSTIVTTSIVLNTPICTAFADNVVSSGAARDKPRTDVPEQPTELKSGDITFQYVSTVFNGKEQKPGVTVRSGDTTLLLNTDFTVSYPEDCVSAGKKTVIIEGTGKYKGQFSATYMIEPLDCSAKNSAVEVRIPMCSYTGRPLTPEVVVAANGINLESGDYTLSFYDNTNVTSGKEKAKCLITFKGNYSGSRTVEFDIAKAPSEDLDIQLMVHNGQRVVYDLSALKPDGAHFGEVKYYAWDFVPEHQPKIAFNELIFTVPMSLSGGTAVVVPVINAPDREDYNIVFYPTTTDKIIPETVIKPVKHQYDGKPVSAGVFLQNGSYAAAEGKQIEGTWEFWTEPPVMPCENVPYIVTFTPTDTRYAPVDSVVFITIAAKKADEFKIKAHRSAISVWQTGQLVISGIPEDYKGAVSLVCDNEEIEITEIPLDDPTQREYEVDSLFENGKFTFTAKLSGDNIYDAAVSQCSILIGDYVPPEEPAENVTTPEELNKLIASAAEGGTVKAEGMRSVAADAVRAASAKRLTLEAKFNDNYTWIINTAELSNRSALDLDISAAVIPAALLNRLGGENILSFNVYANNLGSGTKLRISAADKKNKFANLFLYTTTGELKFISCAKIGADGTADLKISAAGKYAVMVDGETMLKGDLDNNCRISINDVQLLLNEWVTFPVMPEIKGKYVKYDINGDKKISFSDVQALLDIYINMP